MGLVSALLYAASVGLGLLYIEYINFDGADRSNTLTFMFPNVNAGAMFALMIILFFAAAFFKKIVAIEAAAHQPATDAPSEGVKPHASSSPTTAHRRSSSGGVRRHQFFDECGGMRIDRRVDTRRKVHWMSTGRHVGWFDPNEYGGWTVSDEHGVNVGEAPDFPAAATLLTRHLAAR